MRKLHHLLICGALVFASTAVQAQTQMRIRGTITAVEGDVLAVKTREGRDMKIELAPNTTYAYPKQVKSRTSSPARPRVDCGARSRR